MFTLIFFSLGQKCNSLYKDTCKTVPLHQHQIYLMIKQNYFSGTNKFVPKARVPMKRDVGFELCEKPRCKKVKHYKQQ